MAHLVPAVAAERRKADAAENTFVIRPAQRFPVQAARDAMRAVLEERLAHTRAPDWKYSTEGSRALADALRARLKALGLPRYKFVVQLVVGENRGQGFKMATKQLWDPLCDDFACESYTNDNIFAVAVAYGVYLS